MSVKMGTAMDGAPQGRASLPFRNIERLALAPFLVAAPRALPLARKHSDDLAGGGVGGNFVADHVRHHRQPLALAAQRLRDRLAARWPVAIPFVAQFSAVPAGVHVVQFTQNPSTVSGRDHGMPRLRQPGGMIGSGRG